MSDPVVMVAGMRLPLFPRRGRRATESSGQFEPDELYSGVAAISREIGAAGWTTVAVAREEVAPPWSYTVGMWITLRGVDLAMFGVPPDLARTIFDELGTRMADGWFPVPGDIIDDIGTRPLKLCRIHQGWRETSLFTFSDMCHGIVRPPMLQVVWPDPDGRYPGEATEPARPTATAVAARSRACEIQPMCWLPVDDNPPSAWTRFGGLTR
jgi:hypothetical protein